VSTNENFCHYSIKILFEFLTRDKVSKNQSKSINIFVEKLCLHIVRFSSLALLCFAFLQTAPHISAQQPTPVEVKIDAKVFDAYVGQYEDAANLGGTIFSFFREGDKFYGQVPNQDKFEVFPASENKFFLKITLAEAEFVSDAGGRLTAMIWRQGGREFNGDG
jgi:hypothetical protein